MALGGDLPTGNLAKIAEQYLKRAQGHHIEGQLQTRKVDRPIRPERSPVVLQRFAAS